MKASTPPHPAINLSTHLYYQLVYTLTDLLPPPLDGSPEALCTRNHAAIAKVAALLPVNANETDLAPSFACSVAQCIAARAQAEDILGLLRENAHDIALVMRLNAQYGSMVRTSLSVHARLMRVQAVRQKREAIDGAANQDAWTLHVAERSMSKVVDPGTVPQQAAVSGAAPAAGWDQRIAENVSENGANSQEMAFETCMSAQPWNQGSRGSGETDPRAVVREAMAESRFTSWRPQVNRSSACPCLLGGVPRYPCHSAAPRFDGCTAGASAAGCSRPVKCDQVSPCLATKALASSAAAARSLS